MSHFSIGLVKKICHQENRSHLLAGEPAQSISRASPCLLAKQMFPLLSLLKGDLPILQAERRR